MLSLMCSGPRGVTGAGRADCIIERVSADFEMEEQDIRTARDRIKEEKTLLFISNRG